MNGPRSFNDSVKDGTNVRDVAKRTSQLNSKRGGAFYGDSGTELNGGAREDLEKDRYAQGHPGNDVDISQQYAQSEADEYTEHAERMTRSMERDGIPLGMPRDEFVSQFAELLRNPNGN